MTSRNKSLVALQIQLLELVKVYDYWLNPDTILWNGTLDTSFVDDLLSLNRAELQSVIEIIDDEIWLSLEDDVMVSAQDNFLWSHNVEKSACMLSLKLLTRYCQYSRFQPVFDGITVPLSLTNSLLWVVGKQQHGEWSDAAWAAMPQYVFHPCL